MTTSQWIRLCHDSGTILSLQRPLMGAGEVRRLVSMERQMSVGTPTYLWSDSASPGAKTTIIASPGIEGVQRKTITKETFCGFQMTSGREQLPACWGRRARWFEFPVRWPAGLRYCCRQFRCSLLLFPLTTVWKVQGVGHPALLIDPPVIGSLITSDP